VLYAFFASFALTIGALPAFADVLILVDKSTQQMSVSVDGVPRYLFAVSTGRAGYGTPNGTTKAHSMSFGVGFGATVAWTALLGYGLVELIEKAIWELQATQLAALSLSVTFNLKAQWNFGKWRVPV